MSQIFQEDWPPFPETISKSCKFDKNTQLELIKLLYQSQLQSVLVQQTALEKQNENFWAYVYSSEQAVDNARLDVIKSTLNRIQNRAEYIQKAAGTIGTVYSAVLGLSFGFGKGTNLPLPMRGLIPAIFLGKRQVERGLS